LIVQFVHFSQKSVFFSPACTVYAFHGIFLLKTKSGRI
jgi:hypothetical protein